MARLECGRRRGRQGDAPPQALTAQFAAHSRVSSRRAKAPARRRAAARTTDGRITDRQGKAIMSASHRSAIRLPGVRPVGRSQGAQRRGGTHRRAQ